MRLAHLFAPRLTRTAAVLSLALAAAAAAAGAPDDAAVEQRIRRICDAILPPVLVEGEAAATATLAERMAALHVPGVSIAVVHEGRIHWARGFGVARTGGPAVSPDTLFQAASISKPVAALAVLRLAESGKLALDQDVNRALVSWKLPLDAAFANATVTPRRLLSHTAGTTVHGFPGYASDEPRPSLLQVLNGEKPANTSPIRVDVAPGTTWRYSGGGYVVLQQLVQDLSGRPFAELMQDLVLRPIGMAHSTYEQPLPQGRIPEAAMPYEADGTPVRGGPHVYPEMAAAGLWTTPSDLARYAIAVQAALSGAAGSVLSAAMAREMVKPVLGSYGLGLSVGGHERPYFRHGGANAGFQCSLVAYHSGDGAVIMTNGDAGGRLADEVLGTIAREYAWPDFAPPTRRRAAVGRDVLQRYVGRYRLRPGLELGVTLEGEQLMVEATGQPKVPLVPEAETRFFFKVVDAWLEFRVDAAGTASELQLHQGGTEMRAVRVANP